MATAPHQQGAKTPSTSEVRGDETVEEYVTRVVEDRVRALREHGDAQIRQFRADATRLKTTDIPPPTAAPPVTPKH